MQTKQLSTCSVPLRILLNQFKPPSYILYYLPFQGGTSDLILCVLLDLVSVSVLFSPSMCLDIQLGLDSCVANFWERAALSVYHMFSLYFDL